MLAMTLAIHGEPISTPAVSRRRTHTKFRMAAAPLIERSRPPSRPSERCLPKRFISRLTSWLVRARIEKLCRRARASAIRGQDRSLGEDQGRSALLLGPVVGCAIARFGLRLRCRMANDRDNHPDKGRHAVWIELDGSNSRSWVLRTRRNLKHGAGIRGMHHRTSVLPGATTAGRKIRCSRRRRAEHCEDQQEVDPQQQRERRRSLEEIPHGAVDKTIVRPILVLVKNTCKARELRGLA